jgi:polysaccharide deacetylase 2 family uncharacterized protein YibQ
VFRRRDAAIGPGRRPLRPLLLGGAVVAVIALGAALVAWLGTGRLGGLGGGVEVAIPPAQPGAGSPIATAPPRDPEYERLIEGGDPALIERGASGPLPMVADDGRRAWQVYARPFDKGIGKPRIAILIGGLGPASAETQAAIDRLPGGVSLALNPYGQDVAGWIRKARAAQHEVVMAVPMEPVDYPREDPGPRTLLTALSPRQNLDRLEWALSRGVAYVGITNLMGGRFVAAPSELKPIMEVVKGRGLLLLETRVSNQSAAAGLAEEFGVPYALADKDLDGDLSRSGVDAVLAELEQIARRRNLAIATGTDYPLTVERIAAWAATLPDKDIVLAPISAAVKQSQSKEAAPPAPKEPAAGESAPKEKEAPP